MLFVPNKSRQGTYARLKLQFLHSKAGRMVRWTAILVFVCCLHVSARTWSQQVTISAKNQPLITVLKAIEKQTDCNLIIQAKLLENTRPVSINVKNVSLEAALELCFKNQPVTYILKDRTIVLKEKAASTPIDKSQAAPSIALPPPLETITGVVTDSAGKPIPNVSVMVKGTAQGTTTDNDGKFVLTDVDADRATLVFKYVGYNEEELKLNGMTTVKVEMYSKHNALDEIQIIAYGTTTKRFNTGAVSTVTADDIAKQPVNNPLAALEARVPGLYISQATGNADGAFRINLRGLNSIASGNNPLYVIDGVPFTSTSISSTILNSNITIGGSPLSSINPLDIESISVLKDADATSIYGSRGANGVIIITTKKGQSGKTEVNINAYTGVGSVGHKLKLLNTPQYLEMRHEAFRNDNVAPAYYDYDMNDTWDTTRYTDWQKKLIGGNASINDIQTSITGGNENTQFLISGDYHKETTVYPGDFGDKKASVYFNISNTSNNQKFKSQLSGSYAADINDIFQTDLTLLALTLPPVEPKLIDSTGSLIFPDGIYNNNPYAAMLKKYKSSTKNLISNLIVSYQLLKNLQIKASAGYTNLDIDEITTNPITSQNPIYSPQSSASFGNNNFNSWIIEPQAQWESQLGKGKLNILIGSTFQENDQTGQTLDGTGFTNDALLENISGASTITKDPSAPPIDIKYRYQAVFGRINYNLENKYIFNITARRDGSSRFGEGRQFANFGALGVAWIFSEEKLIKNHVGFLSYGKLRISYGTTGNDQITDYGYLSTYSSTTYPYQGSAGLVPTRLSNPDYGWETNKKLETGLDLGFLKDRILFSADYYRNRSSNQLVGYPLPVLSGFSTIQYNLPALVQNTGIELVLNTINIQTANFSWSTSFNVTFPRNKLVTYPGIEKSSYKNKYVVGQPLYIYKAFHYEGVDPQTGIYVFQDVTNGGTTETPSSPTDLQAVKQITQTFYGGFQNNLTYKNWQLSIFLQFVKQTGKNYLAGGFSAPGTPWNQPVTVLDRWQKPGDKTNIQEFTQSPSSAAYTSFTNSQYYGDNVISDASFIRLKNISLSYTLPNNILKTLHLSNAKIYLQGQNLLTITNYLGLDPENQNVANLPPLRILTAGLQLTF